MLSIGLIGCGLKEGSPTSQALYQRLVALEQRQGWRILLCDSAQHISMQVPSHSKKHRDRPPLVSPELNPSMSPAEIKKAEQMLEEALPPPGAFTTDVHSNVYVYSVQNRQAVPIFGMGTKYDRVAKATFAPDGQYIAVWVQTREETEADRAQLVLLDGQGTFQEKLLEAPSVGKIAWSSDGTKLAFVANYKQMQDRFIPPSRQVHPLQGALFIFDLESKTQRTLIESGVGGITANAWSPDDRELVYEGIDDDILVYSFDACQSRTLIAKGQAEGFPTWSPSGEWIAYLGDDRNYHRIHPDGLGQELLLENFRYRWWHFFSWEAWMHPVTEMWGPLIWSPDSQYLLYGRHAGQIGLQTMLHVLDLQSRQSVRLGEVEDDSPLGSWVEQAQGIGE